MKRFGKLAVALALPLAGAVACNDFLTGGELEKDPNRPTEATTSQLFISAQANLFALQSGEVARATCMWVQQCAGTDRQYVALGAYTLTEGAFDAAMYSMYLGGGLIDLRIIQQRNLDAGDSVYAGVAQVMEALIIGTGADLFGDLPYSEAVGGASTPTFDEQLAIYGSVQTLLDAAIANLARGGEGPGGVDLVYGGDKEKWTKLAYTLKARFFMHTAEVSTTPATVYANVITNAAKGITEDESEFAASHRDAPGERNLWYQFEVDAARGGYLSSGKFLVDLLKARNDPRLDDYYSPVLDDVTQDGALCAAGVSFCGAPPNTTAPGTYSGLSEARLNPEFAQPIVTYEENTLLWAEAAALTNQTSVAQAKLTEYQSSVGIPTTPGLTGTALLNEIRTEKYIALFQQIEAWNDYKRTCFPNLSPAKAAGKIPARLYYGTTERQTNPNTPDLAAQDANPRNDNDAPPPASCLAS